MDLTETIRANEVDMTDEELVSAMEIWEENEIEEAINEWDYSYLLNDEVSKCVPF